MLQQRVNHPNNNGLILQVKKFFLFPYILISAPSGKKKIKKNGVSLYLNKN